MKKLLCGILAVGMVFSFAACGGSTAPSTPEPASTDTEATTEADTEAEEEATTEAAYTLPEKVIVGLDENYPPMGFKDETGEIVGFDIDLAKEAFSAMGVDVEFQPIDWDSKELEISTGKIDLIWNGLTITDARKETFSFTEPYIANKQIIIVLNDSEINTKEDMAGKVVGLQKGSSSVDAVNNEPEISDSFGDLIEYADFIAAFMDLEIGRLDVVVADEVMARYYITQNNKDYRVLDEDFGDEEYGIAASKENAGLTAAIDEQLNIMQENGKYEEIYNKWFGGGN